MYGANFGLDTGVRVPPTYEDAWQDANPAQTYTTTDYTSTLQFGYTANQPGGVTVTNTPTYTTTGNKALNTGLVVVAALGLLLLVAAAAAL